MPVDLEHETEQTENVPRAKLIDVRDSQVLSCHT